MDPSNRGAEPFQDEPSRLEDHVPDASMADSEDMEIRSLESSDVEEGRLPLPVWMRESSPSFRWRWVPVPIRTLARSVYAWTKGPDPPQIQKIVPLFPWLQEAPIQLVDRFLPKRTHKAALLAFFYAAWLSTVTLVLQHQQSSGHIEGYGKPSSIWCGANYWYGSRLSVLLSIADTFLGLMVMDVV